MIKITIKFNLYVLMLGIFLLSFPSNAQAENGPGSTLGKVYMMYEGRQHALQDVIINKHGNCAKQKDLGTFHGTDSCIDKSCLGQEYCAQKADLYYTTTAWDVPGSYSIGPGFATYMNRRTGQKYSNCPPELQGWENGAPYSACGFNCADDASPYELKARFPDNYNLNNFPSGIDFRKGKWKVHMSPQIAAMQLARIMNDEKGEYFRGWWPNGSAVNGLDFEWVTDPFPIAGQIKDSRTGLGISGVTILIQNGNNEIKETKTDRDGKYSTESKGFLVGPYNLYAVRINKTNLPPGYLAPPKTTADNWAFIANDKVREDLSRALGREIKDVPKGSESYEFQQSGNSDCAGLAKDGSNRIGRCDFVLDQDPSNPPSPPISSSPPGSADMCSTTLTPLNSFTINGENSSDSLTVPVWFPGEVTNSRTIPVAINANGTCSVAYIKFNYISTVTTPSSPDPVLCAKATGRPDGCACNLDTQCQGQKCDQNRQVCSTEAFIETRGGDVHSNVKIEQ